jgi:hypothetical protein
LPEPNLIIKSDYWHLRHYLESKLWESYKSNFSNQIFEEHEFQRFNKKRETRDNFKFEYKTAFLDSKTRKMKQYFSDKMKMNNYYNMAIDIFFDAKPTKLCDMTIRDRLEKEKIKEKILKEKKNANKMLSKIKSFPSLRKTVMRMDLSGITGGKLLEKKLKRNRSSLKKKGTMRLDNLHFLKAVKKFKTTADTNKRPRLGSETSATVKSENRKKKLQNQEEHQPHSDQAKTGQNEHKIFFEQKEIGPFEQHCFSIQDTGEVAAKGKVD